MLLIVLSIFATYAMAASFDCHGAMTTAEKAICADPNLGALDTKIAELYTQILASAPTIAQRRFRDTQRAWLAKRTDPSKLRTTMQARLDELRQARKETNGLHFLSLNDYGPLYLLDTLPGADVYNKWANDERIEMQKEKSRLVDCQADVPCDSIDYEYTVTFASPETISINKVITEDTGAAHPAANSSNYLFWLSRPGSLSVSDMFTNNRYREIISKFVEKYLRDKDQLPTEPLESKTIMDSTQSIASWTLESTGLGIDAEGPCYACGRIEITVPWSAFKGSIRTDFLKRLQAHASTFKPLRAN